MNNQSTLNLVFSISDPLKTEIIKTSLEIKSKYNSDWWLDNKQYYLHLPLYLFECKKTAIRDVINAGKIFAEELEKIEVKIKDLSVSEGGLIMLEFALPQKLYQYHTKALEIFNPIRNGCLRDKYLNQNILNALSPEDREKVEKYGHIWVLDKYRPHVTIARIKDSPIAEEIIKKYKNKFAGKKALIDRLQIHKAFYGVNDRVELILDIELKD